jgi:formamidopyrimidine-DNA glycosylase
LSWEVFKASFENRKTYIKPVLMDQSVAAGIGNWMADEILYQAKLHPESKVQDLDEEHIEKVYKAMKKVIEVSIENEAVYRDFPEDFLIHNRQTDGKCYRSGDDIQKTKVGGRGTYFCPECQEKVG